MCEATNFVDEKPLTTLKVKLTPHLHNGETRLPIAVNGLPAELKFIRSGQVHTLHYRGPSLEVLPIWAGPDIGKINLHRS